MKEKPEKLSWECLLRGACPKCQAKLKFEGLLMPVVVCENDFCDMKMSGSRFDEIVAKMSKKNARVFNPEENLSGLNNLEI